MTPAPPRSKVAPRSLLAAFLALALAGCAQGATLDGVLTGSGNPDGNGGARGDGGSQGDGGSRAGNGGDGGSHGAPSSSVSTSVTSSDSATSVSSTAQSSSATTTSTSATTAAATTAAATTSSTGGGPVDCDPLNPAAECGGGAHCFPADDGVTGCGEAGSGQDYDSCADHTDCTPLDVCINFGAVCCQRLCVDDYDCPGLDECYGFDTPLYDASGAEYGFCNNGWFDCIE